MRVHPFQVSTFLLHILFSYLLSIPLLLHAQIDLDPEEAEAFAEVQERLEGTRLNPNLATVKDLQIFPWISKSLARQIVATQKIGPVSPPPRSPRSAGSIP